MCVGSDSSLLVGGNVDSAHGALLHAQLAALTLILVDLGQEDTVGDVDGDGLEVADLGTLHAADTTGGTSLAGVNALILVLACKELLFPKINCKQNAR